MKADAACKARYEMSGLCDTDACAGSSSSSRSTRSSPRTAKNSPVSDASSLFASPKPGSKRKLSDAFDSPTPTTSPTTTRKSPKGKSPKGKSPMPDLSGVEKQMGLVDKKTKKARAAAATGSWRSNHGHSAAAKNAMSTAADALNQLANKPRSGTDDKSMMLLMLERMDKQDAERAREAQATEERRAAEQHRRDVTLMKQTNMTNTILAKIAGMREVVDLISPEVSPSAGMMTRASTNVPRTPPGAGGHYVDTPSCSPSAGLPLMGD